MARNQSRRDLLRAATLAAAAGVGAHERLLFASTVASGDGQVAQEPFQLFTADKLANAIKAFHSQPGEHYLYQPTSPPLTIAITTQQKQTGKEFEYHEGRDHVFLILEGATTFELGGTAKDARNTRPGEWLAPVSEGATSVNVKKGDMLVVPRGTPHRQSTEVGVTWMLISASGAAKA